MTSSPGERINSTKMKTRIYGMDDRHNMVPTNVCPACGTAFTCGMNAGLNECWCAAFPPLLAVPEGEAAGSCYCPDCLRKRIEAATLR